MKIVSFSLEGGNKYFGRVDEGPKFLIGTRVTFDGKKGLMNVSGTAAQKYDRAAYRTQHGFWADFLHPTSRAEGALFHTLNTYDRARFTFSFMQYAAHVPNGDFVKYFRALLQLPLASEYFPDLGLQNGRIVRITDDGVIALESDQSTEPLMKYLNPTALQIEDTEVIQSAKFIHWAQNDQEHRDLQVDLAVEHFRTKMVSYANKYGLDSRPETVCLVVADIRHQGRAKSPAIGAALASANPLEALLQIGEPKYHERLVTLRKEIKALTNDDTFGKRVYSIDARDFVLRESAIAQETATGFEQLPQNTSDYNHYAAADRQFGTPNTIDVVIDVARTVHADDANLTFAVGDISFADGREMPPHKAHRRGRNVDLCPIRKDRANKRVTIHDAQYDRDATAQVIAAFLAHANVMSILFNDKTIPGVTHDGGSTHDNHFHVQINA